MAGIKRLVDSNELKTNLWKKTIKQKGNKHPYFYYNKLVDAFTMLLVDPVNLKRVVHYIDEHVALIYEQENKEIIGIRIEAFEHSFLPKYSELEKTWRLSDSHVEINDFGDLTIIVEEYKAKIANELFLTTHKIIEEQGVNLPVYA